MVPCDCHEFLAIGFVGRIHSINLAPSLGEWTVELTGRIGEVASVVCHRSLCEAGDILAFFHRTTPSSTNV
jgi:hypothetical protein